MNFFIDNAFAADAAAPTTMQGLMSVLPMIVLLFLFMYFMVIRPQSKRNKEHKNLISNIQKGDEVMTIGGVLGRIEKVANDFVVINIAENANIIVQKNAISNVVPKGTMKSV
jgi:preprotein translocase subunit YajC